VLLHESKKPVSRKDPKNSVSRKDPLWIQCPTTQESLSISVATDVRSLTKAWHSKIKIACPHCNETHHLKVSEAFTNAAISDERLRGVFSRWG